MVPEDGEPDRGGELSDFIHPIFQTTMHIALQPKTFAYHHFLWRLTRAVKFKVWAKIVSRNHARPQALTRFTSYSAIEPRSQSCLFTARFIGI